MHELLKCAASLASQMLSIEHYDTLEVCILEDRVLIEQISFHDRVIFS